MMLPMTRRNGISYLQEEIHYIQKKGSKTGTRRRMRYKKDTGTNLSLLIFNPY
jgi:hypothetical protein